MSRVSRSNSLGEAEAIVNQPKVQKQILVEAQHPVAIFSMGIGDHLVSLPAVRALADLFDGRLSLICRPGARQEFYRDVTLNKVHETDIRYHFEGNTIRYTENGSQLRPARIRFDAESIAQKVDKCDLLISLNHWHSPSVDELLERLSPANSMGFFSRFKFHFSFYGKHAADVAFAVPLCLDPALRIETFALAPSVLPDIQQWASTWRTRLPGSTKVLAVHAETKASKMWPVHRFVETLDEFLDRHHDVVVLALGVSDLGLDQGKHGKRVVRCYNFPLACAIALMGQADFFLGVDSSMLHAADLFRIPGVGLFGPTQESSYGFRFAPHRHVRGFDQTLDTITVPEVLNALESVFSEHVESKVYGPNTNTPLST